MLFWCVSSTPLWPFVFLRIPQAECFSQSLVLRFGILGIRPFAGAGAHTSATAQGVSNVWEWTPATSGGFFNNEGISSKHEERSKKKPERSPCHEHLETFRNQHWVLGCVLPITWMCYSVPHLIDGLDPSCTFRCCTFRCFTILCGSMAFMGSKHLQHTPKFMEFFVQFEVGKSWKIIQ